MYSPERPNRRDKTVRATSSYCASVPKPPVRVDTPCTLRTEPFQVHLSENLSEVRLDPRKYTELRSSPHLVQAREVEVINAVAVARSGMVPKGVFVGCKHLSNCTLACGMYHDLSPGTMTAENPLVQLLLGEVLGSDRVRAVGVRLV